MISFHGHFRSSGASSRNQNAFLSNDSVAIAASNVNFCCISFNLSFLDTANRRPDGSVGMALVLPALTDCWWWFESLLVHSGVSSATRRKATGADHKKNFLDTAK